MINRHVKILRGKISIGDTGLLSGQQVLYAYIGLKILRRNLDKTLAKYAWEIE